MDTKFKIVFLVVCIFIFDDSTPTRSTVPRALPQENDTFESLRKHNRIYVDKSKYIEKLIESDDRFFIMCRPGRFGKSHFLQMLKSFFEGRKDLFKGLDIYEKHDWRTSYPVIHLDFSTINLTDRVRSHLDVVEKAVTGTSCDIKLDENLLPFPYQRERNISTKFEQLLNHLTKDGKPPIVVLIDEPDWSIRGSSPRAGSNFVQYTVGNRWFQEKLLIPLLHQFERIKDRIKLLLVTCTVKLNYTTLAEYPMLPLKDITFDPQYSGMLGLTEAELTENFKPHIHAIIREPEETFQNVMMMLKERYNGYCFGYGNKTVDCEPLYNFHSVMSCLREKNVDYLWHPAANPKYDIINDYSISEIEKATDWFANLYSDTYTILAIRRNDLAATAHQTYGYDNLPMILAMVLHGYLTLQRFDREMDELVLDFPNIEMRESFLRALLKIIYGRDLTTQQFTEICAKLMNSMTDENAASFVDQLNSVTFAQREDNETRSKDWLQRYSAERIAGIFRVCDLTIKHDSPDPSVHPSVIFHKKVDDDEKHEYGYYGLNVELADQREYRIHFDFNRSAASAMNMLLKEVTSKDFHSSVEKKEKLIHLMGINFYDRGDAIKEWMRITYSHGKCTDLQASHPKYLKMYSYVTHVEPYSSLP